MKKRRRIQWKRLAIVVAALILVIALFVWLMSMMFSGCAGKKADAADDKTTEENKVQMVTMGDSKSGLTPVNIDNQTGQAIVSFKVKKADAADYGENLLGENRIKNNSTAQWYIDPGDAKYYIEIKLANYTTFVLHDVPFDQFNGIVSIKYRDEVGYLEYKPKGSETAISTYNNEVEIKNNEAKQQEAQPAPTDSADAAADNAATDTPAEDTEYYDDGSGYDDSGYYDDSQYYDDGTGYDDSGYVDDSGYYTEEEGY